MKRSRKKTRKNLIIMVAAVAVIIIMVAAIKDYYDRTNVNKPLAKDYLIVEHTKSFGEFYNKNQTVNIRDLGLKITAVGGNATNILITGLPIEGEEYPYIDFLQKGESKKIDIPLRSYVTSLDKTTGLFYVEFTIGCSEAKKCDITIPLKPEDIVGPHY